MKTFTTAVAVALLLVACGDESESGNVSTNQSTSNTATGNSNSNMATNNASANSSTANNASANSSTANNAGSNNATTNNATSNNATSNNATSNNGTTSAACDFEAVAGVVTIEAESLPLNEEWQIGTDEADYQGGGYILWSGQSYNNDPTHGVMSIDIRITEPGRYQLDWRAMIGMGTNTTEHNDAWIRFPDAADYYGLKGEAGAEIRRYYKPKCDDQAAMDAVMALSDVDTADCARGSTRDGWMKVYGAGQEWRWGANTSDSDASRVTAEFPQAGVYTVELAARADFLLLDTIVFHLESVDRRDARGQAETACP